MIPSGVVLGFGLGVAAASGVGLAILSLVVCGFGVVIGTDPRFE